VNKLKTAATAAAGLALGIAPLLISGPAQAHTRTAPLYVSAGAHGHHHAADRSCGTAAYGSIGAAVAAAPTGGTIVVCAGTYHEGVAVTRKLTVAGRPGATVDATGQITGVAVTAAGVTVSGLTVRNAIGEGILVNGVDHATIAGNVVTHNDLGGAPTDPVPNTYPECQANQGVPGDCGEGIHLMGSSWSTVAGNVSHGNSGGILVSDEGRPAAHNRIAGNTVTDNLTACGITVVGHNPAAAPNGVPAPSVAGTFDNDVIGNRITGNGLIAEGAGVVLATGLPGGAVYNNLVQGNDIQGNGLSGVTVHSHAPGQFLNNNVIRANTIGTNNLNGDKDFAPATDTETTGILVATVAPLSIQITDNHITADHFGIWTTGPAKVAGTPTNHFTRVTIPTAHS
jgi:parallel beta-helix repeat protein